MIKFENVGFSYNDKIIFKDFNLKISKGERVCLSAPSGYGKTTLLRLILGLEKIQSGSLKIGGQAAFSVVFQEDRLLPHKTVRQNIALFGDDSRVNFLLEGLGLSSTADLYPSELSGGMARRVSIARALIRDANVLILDEPFTGLDRENTEAAAEFILKNAQGKTIILVTHSKFEAELLGSKIIEI